MRAFPESYVVACPALMVFAPRPSLRLQRADHVFDLAKLVSQWIVPCRVKHHRGGKKLGFGQNPLPPRWRVLVRGQPPACIKRLSKDARFVACVDRFKPHLRGHRIDANGAFKQHPGRNRLIPEFDPFVHILLAEVPLAKPLLGLWMGFDQHRYTGMLLLRHHQHFLEISVGRARGAHGCVIAGLVDHKDITR